MADGEGRQRALADLFANAGDQPDLTLLREIVDNVREVVWLRDAADGRMLYITPSYERVFGRSPASLYADPASFTNAIHPDDRKRVIAARRQLASGQDFLDEYRIVRPDGDVRWIAARTIRFATSDGGGERILGIAEDVSERRRATNELRESVEQHRILFESSVDAVFVSLPDSEILDANPAAERMFGLSVDEMRRSGRGVMHDPTDSRYADALAERERTGLFVGELNHRRGDGTRFPAEITSVLYRDNQGRMRASTIVRDITERKRAEAAIRESEERYRALFEQASSGVVLLEPEALGVVTFNEAACSQLGYTRGEFTRLAIADILTPEERQKFPARFAELRERGHLEFETRHQRKDGRVIDVRVAMRYVEIGGRRLVQSTREDITERKRADAVVRMNQLRLEAFAEIGQRSDFSIDDLLQFALDKCVELTGSTIGYIFLYDEESETLTPRNFSKDVARFCGVSNAPTRYRLAETGIWGDAVREGRPIILNDYSASHPSKKGLPIGHVAISRHLNLPVRDKGRIVAVLGVANKVEPYDDLDTQQLSLLFDSTWRVVERRRAEDALRRHNRRLEVLQEIDRRILAAQSADNLADYVVKQIRVLIPCGRASVGLFDSTASNVRVAAVSEDAPYGDPFGVVRPHVDNRDQDDYPSEPTFYAPNLLDPDLPDPDSDELRNARSRLVELGVRSLLSAPLTDGDEQFGWINLMSVEPDAFDAESRLVLREIADHAAVGFRQVALREELVRQNAALAVERDLLQTLMDGVADGIYFKDAESRFVRNNRTHAERVVNPRAGSIIGKTDMDIHDPDLARQTLADEQEIIRTGRPLIGKVERFVSPEGRERWVSTSKVPWRDSSGRIVGTIGIGRDITEQRQAEEALLASAERLNRAQEIAHLGSWELDVASGRLTWSDEAYRIFGFQPNVVGATYEMFLDLVHPDDRAAVDAAYTGSLREGRNTYEIEHRVVRGSTGEIRFVHEKCEHLRDATGQIVRSVGMTHDITERKRAEEALRASESRFRGVFDQSPIGIELYDRQGILVEANQANLQIFGVSDVSAIRGFRMFDDPNLPADAKARVQAGETVRYESNFDFDLVRRLGLYETSRAGELTLDVVLSPLRGSDGAIVGYLAQVQDVTARRRADLVVRANQVRLAALAELGQRLDLSLTGLSDVALETALELTNSRIGYLYSYDETTQLFTLHAWSNEVMADCMVAEKQSVYSLAQTGIWGEVVRQRRPIVVNDFAAPHPHKRGLPDGHVRLARFASIPVFSDDAIVAVVGVANKVDPYDDADVQQLTLLLEGVFRLIERRRAEDDVRRRNRRLEILQEIDRHILAAHSADEIAAYAVGQIRALVPCSRASVGLFDLVANTARVAAVDEDVPWGNPLGFVDSMSEDREPEYEMSGPTRYTPDTLLIERPWTSMERLIARGVRSLLAAPLIADGKLLGVLNLMSPSPNAFFEEHRLILREIADHLAVGFRQAALREELVRQNEALAGERDLLQSLMDSASDAIYFKDTESHIIRSNQAQVDLLAMSRIGSIIGKTDAEFLDAEFARETLADELEIIRTGKPLLGKVERIAFRDGRVTWMSTSKVARRDASGQIVGTIGIGRDITEQRQAEEAIRESQEKYRTLFEASADAVFLVDRADGRLLDANAAASRIYGYSHDEFLSMTNLDVSAEPERTRAATREMQPFVPIRYHRKKDGTVFPVEMTAGEMTLGDGRGVFIVAARDVSERTRTDQAIRRYNERLQILQELDRLILAAHSADEIAGYVVGQIRALIPCVRASVAIFDNDAGTYTMAAVSEDAPFGDPAGSVRPISDNRAARRDIRGATRYVPDALEFERPWPSRERIVARGVRSLLTAPLVVGGERLGMLDLMAIQPNAFTAEHREILAEIANQVAIGLQQAKLREELVRHNTALERQVAVRTQELREVNAELKTFAYSVSHDLRAPLRALQGYSQILIDDYAEEMSDESREFAQRIHGTAQRMDRLVKDVLAFSRVTRAEIDALPLDLGWVVDEALGQLEGQLAECGARVEVARPLPTVFGHQATLVQVATNLIGNAAKYVAAGVRPEIAISAESSPNASGFVRLSVRDNGIGIAGENQERVFAAFERLHGVEEYPGSGLGLAIVKKGIERLGGRVGVESALGVGSRFWFELPTAND